MPRKLLILDIAAFGWNLVSHLPEFRAAQSIFPAVTCPVQASVRTGLPIGEHGLVANGLFFEDVRKVLFWEQSARLVQGARIWDEFRSSGKKVGLMFWQQSLGENVDLVVSPWPVHKHSGGMIQSCFTKPPELEHRINERVGRPFNLMNYWGPLANHKSSDWIVDAICAVMEMSDVAPDALFAYIPHLDYDLQRYGPDSPEADKALDVLLGYLTRLKAKAEECGYDWLVFGDYAIEPVTHGAVFPNRTLREAGLFVTRDIRGMAYPDFYNARAFAMCDHGFAHVFCADERATENARSVLQSMPGVAEVWDIKAQQERGLANSRSGQLIITSKPGTWFAYPWFTDRAEAPDFASHVDIHNKPGYDPCELFFGWPPGSVSFDTRKIHGTHGSNRHGLEIAWATSLSLETQPKSQLEIADAIKSWMQQQN
jgi:predicted AlkP superfamily pyrophosphatase or phosphodiesterase